MVQKTNKGGVLKTSDTYQKTLASFGFVGVANCRVDLSWRPKAFALFHIVSTIVGFQFSVWTRCDTLTRSMSMWKLKSDWTVEHLSYTYLLHAIVSIENGMQSDQQLSGFIKKKCKARWTSPSALSFRDKNVFKWCRRDHVCALLNVTVPRKQAVRSRVHT